MMKRMIAMAMALCMMAGTSLVDAQTKPDKKQRQKDIQRLLELKADEERSTPLMMLMNNEACFDFCMNSYYRPEEEYAKDTTAIMAAYQQNDWILKMCESLTEKERKKYHLEDVEGWMQQIMFEKYQTRERYDAMTRFCDGIYNQRRRAAVRTMPTGKLKHFLYEEFGSSRPDPVYYEVLVDSATGKAILRSMESRRMGGHEGQPQVAVGKEVLEKICQMVEQKELYKKLEYYSRPHIPGVPEITGGPPSWNFTCELENGKISMGGSQMDSPNGCEEIANYLDGLLRAEKERLRRDEELRMQGRIR